MKSSEVLRWAFRHSASIDFSKDEAGMMMTVTTKAQKKNIIVVRRLLLRDHDKSADDICRFVDALSTELNLE